MASANTLSGSITVPTTGTGGSVVAGDVAHLAVSINNGTSCTLTTPSGWTLLGSQVGGGDTIYDFIKVLTSGDIGASVTLAVTVSSRFSALMDVRSGVDNTTPVVAGSWIGIGYNPGTATATHVAPSYTTTQACLVIQHYSDKGAPGSSTMTTYPSVTGATYTGTSNTGTITGSAIESTFTCSASVASGVAAGGGTYTAGTPTTSTAISLFALNPATGGTSASASGSITLTGTASASAAPALVNVTQEVSQTTLELAAKVTNTSSVVLKVSTSNTMSSPVYTSGTLTPDSFGYVHPVATGLTAGTVYYWQLYDAGVAFGGVQPTKTLKPSGSAQNFTVAFGGCVTTNNTEGRALADLIAWAPDFWLHLGDFHYHNPTATVTATHLANYEDQYANSTGGNLATACKTIPIFYNRSDHDAGPSDNGDSDLTDFPGNANSIAATQVFFPTGTLADSRSPKVGLYRTWVVGRVRFIQIDIRNTDRAPGANDQTAAKTMLGATQLAWLKTQLTQPEPFKVIVSDVAWMGTIADQFPTVADGKDKWPSYPLERTDIANYIAANNCGHVEVWHSDSHLIGYATAVKNSAAGGFPVLCAAPFANTGGGLFTSTFSAFYNASGAATALYGRVTFTDDGTTITRKFDGYDAVNNVVQVTDTVTVTAASANGSIALTGSAGASAKPTATGTLTLTGGAAAKASTTAAGSITLTGSATVAPPGAAVLYLYNGTSWVAQSVLRLIAGAWVPQAVVLT